MKGGGGGGERGGILRLVFFESILDVFQFPPWQAFALSIYSFCEVRFSRCSHWILCLQVLRTWPLTTVRRWAASPNSFTLVRLFSFGVAGERMFYTCYTIVLSITGIYFLISVV